MAEARLDAMVEQQRKMKKELDRANDFAKNLMVEQAKGEAKSPADKRAVGYLVEEQYDIKELVRQPPLLVIRSRTPIILSKPPHFDRYHLLLLESNI